jgi:hypothetical protein
MLVVVRVIGVPYDPRDPHDPRDPRSASTDLARRARARDVAAVGGRPPRLVRLRFRRSLGFRGGRVSVSWRLRYFRGGRGLGPRRARLLLVLLQTAVLVLATRAAVARLVAARSWLALVRHWYECTVPTSPCYPCNPWLFDRVVGGSSRFGSPPPDPAVSPGGPGRSRQRWRWR